MTQQDAEIDILSLDQSPAHHSGDSPEPLGPSQYRCLTSLPSHCIEIKPTPDLVDVITRGPAQPRLSMPGIRLPFAALSAT
jgi:hypothetical protein